MVAKVHAFGRSLVARDVPSPFLVARCATRPQPGPISEDARRDLFLPRPGRRRHAIEHRIVDMQSNIASINPAPMRSGDDNLLLRRVAQFGEYREWATLARDQTGK